MANSTPAYRTENAIGANFQHTFTPDPSSGYDNAPFAAGTVMKGTDNSRFVYVKALTALNQGDAVIYDKNGNAQQLTTALAAAGVGRIGACQVVGGVAAPVTFNGVTTYTWAWVAIEGDDLGVNVATGTAAGSALATTGTPGVLGTPGGGQTTIGGIATNAANASGAAAVTSCAASSLRLVN